MQPCLPSTRCFDVGHVLRYNSGLGGHWNAGFGQMRPRIGDEGVWCSHLPVVGCRSLPGDTILGVGSPQVPGLSHA